MNQQSHLLDFLFLPSWIGLLPSALTLLSLFFLGTAVAWKNFRRALPDWRPQELFKRLKFPSLSAAWIIWKKGESMEKTEIAGSDGVIRDGAAQDQVFPDQISWVIDWKLVAVVGLILAIVGTLGYNIGWQVGYRERDREAYTNLHTLRHMTVVGAHSPTNFDLMNEYGTVTKAVYFCEPLTNLRRGIRFDMAAYYVKTCFSLNGPHAWHNVDTQDGVAVVHKIFDID
jgi:hypothetical protein